MFKQRPHTRAQIERELRKGADHATLISQQCASGVPVTVLNDDGSTTETVTTSQPWQLGHGQWIVKLQGYSGGYDCARVTIRKS